MPTTTKQLKTLTKADQVSLIFGEWFDKTYGNTYYDCEVWINDQHFQIEYQYGYNHGDQQAVDEALAHCGYRVRSCSSDRWRPYKGLHTKCLDKLKRDLFKSDWNE